jgi:predicted HicB family RNase H-like nuclease
MIPERIMFSIANHTLVSKAAEAAGKSINDYVHDHVINERA